MPNSPASGISPGCSMLNADATIINAAAKLFCLSILRRVDATPVHCGEGAYDAVPASFEIHRSRAYVEGHVDVLRQRVVELVLVHDQDVLVIFGLLVGEYLPAALFFKIFDFKLQPAPVFVHMRANAGLRLRPAQKKPGELNSHRAD